ncbi:hypothetical protein [Halomonas cerina]|uniref:Uncharacterized protein n=1 Tax=Halomonas cerina TaxID=447424 RepID=A0A839V891_9GAMM|nr:hypothetical protein [Halomonas cerina]MBB3191873.1 hypothetical protein [Halomonas cerina]
MSNVDLQLERLQISLHGVSAEVAESAMTGLDEELRRRLGGLSAADLPLSDQAELALGAIHVQGRIDPAALRGLIAQRLVASLRQGGQD